MTTATAQQLRKAESRKRLMEVALSQFAERGYSAVSVEDIAAAAAVSRMTFYRQFRNKSELATALFAEASAGATPRFLRIAEVDYNDRTEVLSWVRAQFAADRDARSLLRVFLQATSEDEEFTARAQQLLADLIAGLGARIPAFDLRPDRPADRRRWLEAWLLVYEILDQSNHAALDSGIAGDPLVAEILADRFLAFVRGGRP